MVKFQYNLLDMKLRRVESLKVSSTALKYNAVMWRVHV